MKENLKNLRLEFEKENTYFSVCCQHYALILVCCQHYALILICCQHYALILDGDDNYSVFGYGYEHRRHSRRRSRSLMRRWHKTCFLAARTLHISFILPPAPVVTLVWVSSHLSDVWRPKMLLICIFQGSISA